MGKDPSSGQLAESLKTEISGILVSANSNLAACHVKLEKWDKVIKCCDKVLEKDADNAKAYYRRALAHHALNNLDKAQADLRKGIELAPTDPNIRNLYEKVRERLRDLDEKGKRELRGMFERSNISI